VLVISFDVQVLHNGLMICDLSPKKLQNKDFVLNSSKGFTLDPVCFYMISLCPHCSTSPTHVSIWDFPPTPG
jgi:hypothetical protein